MIPFIRKTNFHFLIFLSIFIITLFIRFKVVGDYNIAFTPDQARDMFEIRQIAVNLTPKFIGPITDILGLYLGPFWYYLNLIPFVIFGGNPLGLVYFSIIIFHISSIVIYFLLSKIDKVLGALSSSLLLLSPIAFLTTRYSFNANAVFYFTSLYPLFIFFKSKKASFLEGLLCGLILQLQAAIGILFFPISFYFHYKRKRTNRYLLSLSFGFFMTLVPQIIFEIKHQLLMTKALFAEFLGGSGYLGAKFSITKIIADRYAHALSTFAGATYLPAFIVISIIAVALLLNKKKTTQSRFLTHNLKLLLIFFVFFLLFPYKIKDWYIFGLVPFTVFAFASALKILTQYSKAIIVIVTIFCLAMYTSISSNISYFQSVTNNPSNDPSNLRNMISTVDNVYKSSANESFKVYTYLPSVYDYAYQYLFWWYGTKVFGYQPAEMSYLPDVPEYIKDNATYWTKIKETPPIYTYLIIQHDLEAPDRESNWRDKFDKNIDDRIDLSWNTTIEKINSSNSNGE